MRKAGIKEAHLAILADVYKEVMTNALRRKEENEAIRAGLLPGAAGVGLVNKEVGVSLFTMTLGVSPFLFMREVSQRSNASSISGWDFRSWVIVMVGVRIGGDQVFFLARHGSSTRAVEMTFVNGVVLDMIGCAVSMMCVHRVANMIGFQGRPLFGHTEGDIAAVESNRGSVQFLINTNDLQVTNRLFTVFTREVPRNRLVADSLGEQPPIRSRGIGRDESCYLDIRVHLSLPDV